MISLFKKVIVKIKLISDSTLSVYFIKISSIMVALNIGFDVVIETFGVPIIQNLHFFLLQLVGVEM